MGDRVDGWPWSALGIDPTADRETIYEAYATRKAALDAQVMRVSAFAELSEAREKALFLAAEMRRAVERGEEPSPVSRPTPPEPSVPLPPTLPPESKAPPPPVAPATDDEPEVEPKPPISAQIAASSMAASLPTRAVATPMPPEPSAPPPPILPAEPKAPPQPTVLEPEAEDKPESDLAPPTTLRVSVPVTKDREPEPRLEPTETRLPEYAPPPKNLPTLEEEARDLLEFLQLRKRWPFFVVPVFFLIAMCSGDEDDRRTPVVSNDAPFEIAPEPAIEPTSLDQPRADAMVAALFGAGLTYDRLSQADQPLAWNIANRLADGDPGFDQPRAYLRARILKARHRATPDQALAIAELYLAWLQTAQRQEEGGCREVTSGLFFGGTPAMREDWVSFEQSLAAQLATSGAFALANTAQEAEIIEYGTNAAALPQWALDQARTVTELEATVFLDALNEISHPARCRVEIALLEALLARRADVTPQMIAAL